MSTHQGVDPPVLACPSTTPQAANRLVALHHLPSPYGGSFHETQWKALGPDG
jgi:hypothetical protein